MNEKEEVERIINLRIDTAKKQATQPFHVKSALSYKLCERCLGELRRDDNAQFMQTVCEACWQKMVHSRDEEQK
jgi:hypothetical protein